MLSLTANFKNNAFMIWSRVLWL